MIRANDGIMRITDRTGASLTSIQFADLFLLPEGSQSYQSKIYFDSRHGRWIAIGASRDCVAGGGATYGHGYLDFAISDTANPKLGWSIYYYMYPDAFIQEPNLGSSSDKFVLTSRYSGVGPACGGTGSEGWDLTVLEWGDVLGHDTFAEAYSVFPYGGASSVEYLMPAVDNGATSSDIHVIAETYEGLNPRLTWEYRFVGAVPGGALHPYDLVTPEIIPSFGFGAFAAQPNGNHFAKFGPTSVVTAGSRLVSGLSEPCTPTGDSAQRSCVRIVDLDVSTGPPTRRQDFYLALNGYDTWDPGIAFTQSGQLIISYLRSTSVTGPIAYTVRQAPGDALHTVSSSRVIQANTGTYDASTGADTISAARDPLAPDTAWLIAATGLSFTEYRTQVAQARTATGDTYVPIPPARVLDSRFSIGLSGFFWNGVPRTFNVAGAGGIPADAVAVTGNLTVAYQNRAGYVSVGPSVSANPSSSTINFPQGEDRANNLTLPLNADGDLQAVYKGPADGATALILDVTGYFLADDTGTTYEPLTPVRVLDSRFGMGLSGRFAVNTPRTFQVAGVLGVPAGAVAVTGNLTVVGQSRAGYVSLTPEPDGAPDTSTINFPVGDTRANGLTVQLSDTGSLSAVYKASSGSTDLIFDVTGYYVDDLTGLRFYPLNPGRIMDTRFNTLTQLYGAFSSSVPRTLVTGGHFGVPADGLAVTGNLTVVGQTAGGYVSITKNQTATPPVSTINFPLGDVRANGVTVPLNANNDMALVYKATSGAKTQLILDLTGYFR